MEEDMNSYEKKIYTYYKKILNMKKDINLYEKK